MRSSDQPIATLAAHFGMSLVAAARLRGHTDADVLTGTGLKLSDLQNPRGRITARQVAALAENLRRLWPDDALAYKLGLHAQVTHLGIVGYGLLSCATLGDAVDFSVRCVPPSSIFQARITTEGDWTVVTLQERAPLGELRTFMLDMTLVLLCTVLTKLVVKDLTRERWPMELRVPYAAPPAHERYKDRLPVFHFGAPLTQFCFQSADLLRRIPTANPASLSQALLRCDQELVTNSTIVRGTVSAQVIGCIKTAPGRYQQIDEVASDLAMSIRTLKRKLAQESATFKSLVEQLRFEDSARLLADPSMPIHQVAEAVAYSDPTNFSRAFSKWTGMTPREWRQRCINNNRALSG